MKQLFLIVVIAITSILSGISALFPDDLKAEVPKDDYNIVLITIDALRADHLSCYGYERKTSPNIDKIAEQGIIFKNAIAPCSWTAPSMVSLFTSLYPINHGTTHGFGKGSRDKQEIFSDELTTLTEILKSHGYTTFGVASNLHLREKLGFARGFDYFKCLSFLPANHVHKIIASWEGKIRKADKYFLWIHYIDPHAPYQARNPWYAQYISHASIPKAFSEDEKFASTNPMELTNLMYMLKQSPDEQSKQEAILFKKTLLTRYDSEINYVDSYIGEIIKKFNLDQNTLIIITADHGEEIFEHYLVGHGFNLYQKALHIPLIIKLPYSSKKETVEKYTNLVDIMPTILHLLDIDLPRQTLGNPVIIKRGPLFWVKKIFSRTEMAEHSFAELNIFSDLKTIITPEWKHIYNYQDKTEELYNLNSDPLELNNLVDKKTEQCKKLKEQLFNWVSSAKQYPTEKLSIQLSPEERKKLESMGYLQVTDDIDKDGIPDNDDNCPYVFNPTQEDTYPPSGNGIGDACDCEGDFNCDGKVNAADAGLISGGFKKRTNLSNPCTNEKPCCGDFDCDGDVDKDDQAIFYADFGRGKNNNPCPPCEAGDWCSY